jgi:hypothetical protein
MRISRFVFLLVLLTFAKSAPAQQATASTPQATAFLQQALTALSGGHTVNDITLSGTAQRIAGSDDESGTVVLKALAAGASRMDLSLPSGTRSEVQNTSTDPPTGSWSASDGVSHPISLHNLLSDPAWFFPLFSIARGLSSGYVATYIGPETRNGQDVQHLTVSQASAAEPPTGSPSFGHLTQMDFFLDPTSLLPVALTFSAHPDTNAGLDIPIEIRFSDYRPVSGAQIPFHVRKFINNGLTLDLQLDSVFLNSGLSQAAFAVGAGL